MRKDCSSLRIATVSERARARRRKWQRLLYSANMYCTMSIKGRCARAASHHARSVYRVIGYRDTGSGAKLLNGHDWTMMMMMIIMMVVAEPCLKCFHWWEVCVTSHLDVWVWMRLENTGSSSSSMTVKLHLCQIFFIFASFT